ncbi:hypothetical protein [Streptomyces sp. NPDC004680]|uniref:hypothetical protein n=1 Tax=Streptomyces sp. NPDC004680 TaxID=3154287 RepID=UPI0033A2C428
MSRASRFGVFHPGDIAGKSLSHPRSRNPAQSCQRSTWRKDLALLPDAAKKGFEAFLTKDGRQLEDPSETAAIKKSGMHHIRFSHGHKGMVGLGLAMGAVVAAMPLIVRDLDKAESQQLIHIKGLNPGSKQRFDLVDPSKTPPRYWPR